MVVAPHELPAAAAELDQGEALERRAAELEAALAVGDEAAREKLRLAGRRQAAPVVGVPLRIGSRAHQLERLLEGREKGGTEDRMAGGGPQPRPAPRCGIEGAHEGPAELLDIGARARRLQGVKQHPLLHGGERIEVFDLPIAAQQTVDRILSEARTSSRGVRRARGLRSGPLSRAALNNPSSPSPSRSPPASRPSWPR